MRRYLLLLLIIIVGLSLITAVFAQENDPQTGDAAPASLQLASPPVQMVDSGPPLAHPQPVTATRVLAVDASNDCSGATALTVPGGGSAVVNSFATAESDPQLSCMWGTPSSHQGYRSAWYRFEAPENGQVTISTRGSSYDTVLAVFADSNPDDATTACADIADPLTGSELACNDDSHGFTSEVTLTVQKDRTYYVEVVDWQAGVSGQAELLISLQMDPVSSRWEKMGTMTQARTRHATAVVFPDIYVIGGQTSVDNTPALTNRLDRYEADTNRWVALGQMPGPGLSNTTAVFVNRVNNQGGCSQGCLYVPGGYNGNNTTFDGRHLSYDPFTNAWIEKASIGSQLGWPDGAPFAWSAALTAPDQTGYYLMGGLSSQPSIAQTAVVHNKVYFYRVADNQWLDAPPDMQAARYGHMAARLGNRLCVVGGITNDRQLVPDGECWNTAGGANWNNEIPPLNIARYGAGSAVGPDGKWYIFGGSDGGSEESNHQAISVTEVYDPANPALGWTTLPVSFDLGNNAGNPARAWPRGGFVGNHLWAIGGNATIDSQPVVTLMERLFIGRNQNFMPMILKMDPNNLPDDHFGVARPLAFNVPVLNNFNHILDFHDVYYFDLTGFTAVTVRLSQIPSGSDYNVFVYDANKQLRASGVNPGNLDEAFSVTLLPGRYYVMVVRAAPAGLPNTSSYRLIVSR